MHAMKNSALTQKLTSLIVFLFFTASILGQERILSTTKEISGKVTYQNAPLSNVNIIIKDSKKGTKTNKKGEYSLKAKIGDVLQYSYVGFKTVTIVVEDITSILNIKMVSKVNQLNETVVVARKKLTKISELERKLDIDLKTPFGTFNPKKSGFDIKYLGSKDINLASPSIESALDGKFAGVKAIGLPPTQILLIRGLPVTYLIDGMTFKTPPPMALSNIEDIYIIKIKRLVVVITKNSFDALKEKRKEITEQYTNHNYYNNDAKNTDNKTTFSSNTKTSNKKTIQKTISGNVSFLYTPLVNVNIVVTSRAIGTKTNNKGEYTLNAFVGDVIQFSHLGYATVSIIVEDVTTVLNIEMVPKDNELDLVTVTAQKAGEVLEHVKKANKSFSTSRGNMDPKRSGYAMSFLEGEKVSSIYSTLGEALDGKISGVRYDQVSKKLIVKPKSSINTPLYPIWDVDGVIFDEEPPLNLDNIKDVRILKTLAGTNRYGSAGAGGVVVVQTKNGNFNATKAQQAKIAEQYTNKSRYANDAIAVSSESFSANAFTYILQEFNDIKEAFAYYNKSIKNQVADYTTHISIAQLFVSYYYNSNIAKIILNEQVEKHNKNPEILKAIAYQFQAIGLKKEAILQYQNVFKLRPNYAQSYRDLANAYNDNEQFKRAWRLYMSYLMQGNDVSGSGIGELIYNEMEWLYFNRKNQTQIKQQFVPKSENLLDFRNDIRLVFEWNTSEAEFDMEFVSPDKRAYVFEHSLAANQKLITNEKQKGYSSKEFIIEDIGNGEWLVNLSYLGNKKPEPTYFKLTTYYNWGKPNQRQETSLYKLQNQRDKIQLLKLNKQVLITAN
jgi:hypothetical protein